MAQRVIGKAIATAAIAFALLLGPVEAPAELKQVPSTGWQSPTAGVAQPDGTVCELMGDPAKMIMLCGTLADWQSAAGRGCELYHTSLNGAGSRVGTPEYELCMIWSRALNDVRRVIADRALKVFQ